MLPINVPERLSCFHPLFILFLMWNFWHYSALLLKSLYTWEYLKCIVCFTPLICILFEIHLKHDLVSYTRSFIYIMIQDLTELMQHNIFTVTSIDKQLDGFQDIFWIILPWTSTGWLWCGIAGLWDECLELDCCDAGWALLDTDDPVVAFKVAIRFYIQEFAVHFHQHFCLLWSLKFEFYISFFFKLKYITDEKRITKIFAFGVIMTQYSES